MKSIQKNSKKHDFLAMSAEQARAEIISLSRSLLMLRIQKKSGEVKSHLFSHARRAIARCKTALRSKALAEKR